MYVRVRVCASAFVCIIDFPHVVIYIRGVVVGITCAMHYVHYSGFYLSLLLILLVMLLTSTVVPTLSLPLFPPPSLPPSLPLSLSLPGEQLMQ